MEPTSLIQSIDMGAVRGAVTGLTMAIFGGIVWWAYRSGNRERFEADARIPFADELGDEIPDEEKD